MKSEYKLGGIIETETETVIIQTEEIFFLWEWMFLPLLLYKKKCLWVVIVVKCKNLYVVFFCNM